MSERTKDPIIGFRSVIRGKNSKGGDRIQLYIGGSQKNGNEDLIAFIAVLQEQVDNPKGAKIDLHVSKKEHEGRSFDSAFAFVKPVADGGFGGAGRAGGTYTSKPKTTNTDMEARVAALKAKGV